MHILKKVSYALISPVPGKKIRFRHFGAYVPLAQAVYTRTAQLDIGTLLACRAGSVETAAQFIFVASLAPLDDVRQFIWTAVSFFHSYHAESTVAVIILAVSPCRVDPCAKLVARFFAQIIVYPWVIVHAADMQVLV